MNITVIHGQNHKGTTYTMAHILLRKLKNVESVREFFLPRDLNHFCVGCYRCIEDETDCPFYGEKKEILTAMEKSDLFIFTSPNYCMAPSAPMKSFLDLMFDYWMVHRPKAWMFQKRAVILSSSAGASCKHVVSVVRSSLAYWGVSDIKACTVAAHAKNPSEISAAMSKKIDKKLSRLACAVSCERPPRISPKTKMLFFILSRMHKVGFNSSPCETAYWKERGWLDKKRPWKN